MLINFATLHNVTLTDSFRKRAFFLEILDILIVTPTIGEFNKQSSLTNYLLSETNITCNCVGCLAEYDCKFKIVGTQSFGEPVWFCG